MLPPDTSIRRAQKKVEEYLKARGQAWTGLEEHYYLVTHLVEEVGELARAVINIESKEEDPARRGLDAPLALKHGALRDGLGDIFFHVLKICVAYDLDLQEAFRDSLASIKRRYPTPSAAPHADAPTAGRTAKSSRTSRH